MKGLWRSSIQLQSLVFIVERGRLRGPEAPAVKGPLPRLSKKLLYGDSRGTFRLRLLRVFFGGGQIDGHRARSDCKSDLGSLLKPRVGAQWQPKSRC